MRNIIKIDVNLKVEAIYNNTFNIMSFIYQKQGFIKDLSNFNIFEKNFNLLLNLPQRKKTKNKY
jgi:hypothetical protein